MKRVNAKKGFYKMTQKKPFSQTLKVLLALTCGLAPFANAQQNADYAADPALTQPVELSPKVMLSMSVDHQLFIKAYNDFDDLDGDGKADVTYTNTYRYVGYFDNDKCYQYADGVFSLAGDANEQAYCVGDVADAWSGNFLNWATMTRIDLVRHVLYGGYRSTDTADQTILERSYLPQDGHSFAKHYTGSDINDLVGTLPANVLNGCSSTVPGQCDGITFCNTSRPPEDTVRSQDINTETSPPLLRVIAGDYSLWASGERFQCLAVSEHEGGNPGDNGDTGNAQAITGIPAFSSSPATTQGIWNFFVRVEVCTDNSGAHSCKKYPGSTNYKPTGLLHEYGETGEVEFGLITGSYFSNKDGGALRSNIRNFSEEVNDGSDDEETNDGTFKYRDDPDGAYLIGNLDSFRIVDYVFGGGANSGTYFNPGQAGHCPYGLTEFDNGDCRNWGNPFSEILADSYRYFSGTPGPLTDDADGETGFLPGLTVDDWPLQEVAEEEFACSRLSVLGFNASVTSYDDNLFYNGATSISVNELLSRATDNNSQTIAQLTDHVGAAAGFGELPAGDYFVGNAGELSDDECSAKTISDGALSTVRGVCPEGPRLGGSYLSAGMAHYFNSFAETPISTYGVTMAGNKPNITLRISDTQTLTIIPACMSNDLGRCALVSFRAIGEPVAENGTFSGKYFVSWEDSEQGGDYDSDLLGVLEYEYASGSLSIETTVFYESTGDKMDFGYIVSGTQTAADGAYYPSFVASNGGTSSAGAPTQWCLDNGVNDDPTPSPSCSSANHQDDATRTVQTVTFSVSTGTESTAGKFLEEPLYYASKWGSFIDRPGGVPGQPDSIQEWKIGSDEDGYDEMRGYTAVSDPAELTVKMQQIFKSLIDQPPVATSTGVSLSSATGVGLLVNSLYYPEKKSIANEDVTVSWVGSLNGLLRGRDGYTREDANGNGYVDSADPVISFVKENGIVTATRYTPDNDGFYTPAQTDIPLGSVNYLWDVESQLRSLSQDDLPTQRAYDEPANTSRHILTGVKADGADQVTQLTDFVATDEALAVFGDKLGVGAGVREKLVNFIRGVEGLDGMRSRTLDGVKYLLGDTVNSTPLVVGPPDEFYDLTRDDASYAKFRKKYEDRRNVVYVGANDGMLHAFNAGFEHPKQVGYHVGYDSQGVTQHPLGSELWSYVPYNLLPHLQWLGSPEYKHVFYMDGDLQSFDVNIFGEQSAETYPGGWGTILVAGMRLGGGEITVGGETFRSAYVIFDITDPEVPPKLLAEVTAKDLGYTTSNVQLMVHRNVRAANLYASGEAEDYTSGDSISFDDKSIFQLNDDSFNQLAEFIKQQNEGVEGLPELLLSEREESLINSAAARLSRSNNDWYLVFGSGPTSHTLAISGQPAKLFYLQLNDLPEVDDTPLLQEVAFSPDLDPAVTEAFVGGITIADWEEDFIHDDIYFGLVENSTIPAEGETPEQKVNGRLMHARIDFSEEGLVVLPPTQVLIGQGSTDFAFSSEPYTVIDKSRQRWLYAGTGRFYVAADTSVDEPNAYMGIRLGPIYDEEDRDEPIALDELANVSEVQIRVSGEDYLLSGGEDLGELTDIPALRKLIAGTTAEQEPSGYKGWLRYLESETELISDRSAFATESLFVNTYDPLAALGDNSGNLFGCDSLGFGRSYTYALDMYSGLPQLGYARLGEADGGFSLVIVYISTYGGYVAAPTVISGTSVAGGKGPGVTIASNDGTGGGGKPPCNPALEDCPCDPATDSCDAPPTVGDLPPTRQSWREISLEHVNVEGAINDIIDPPL